ncbi:hypothetical protein BaRGS_00031077, partial [Batillaria attramentaria]
SPRPNVLFLVVDDLRPLLGAYGEKYMVTPNIDNLASRSVRFERAYIQHFKDNGYVTQSAGKIFHPGPASGNTFDYPYSWSNPAYYAPSTDDMYGKGNLHVIAVCPVYNMTLVPHGTLPDIQVADFAVEWLRNKSRQSDDQPFFLAVGFHKPHLPWRYPAEFLKLYPISTIPLAKDNVFPQWLPAVAWNPWHNLRQREDVAALNISWPYGPVPEDFQLKMKQSYSAAASYTDSQLGRVLQALDEGGFANTTIISFHGDHAPCQDDSSGVRQPATVAGGAGEVGG